MVRITIAAVAGLLLAPGASATDGVIEINQARAAAGAITPGDTAGFPVTLSTPGSYVLTGNLSVTSSTLNAVVISASWVTLDLGGFEIAGPGTCTGIAGGLSCTVSNSTNGVVVGGLTTGVRVLNGTVRGFGANGVDLGNGTAERLRVSENAAGGISTTFSSANVIDSFVDRNRGTGIQNILGIVRGCTVSRNFGVGISGSASLIEANMVRGNGTIGINGGPRSLVRNNVVTGNTADGIVVTSGALVIQNATSINGQAGISALSTSSIQGNISYDNTGVGLYLFPEGGGAASAYRENVVAENGSTVTSGVNLGDNLCNGATSCP
jgi:hypothetical protein